MKSSPVIGVIDLCDGQAVHAIAGRRTDYRPAIADGVPDGNAIELANRYLRLGVNSFYVADLNAIAGNSPNATQLNQLSSIASEILIDAGAFAGDVADYVEGKRNVRVIVPTECFETLSDWTIASKKIARGKAVLGLDLAGNRLRSVNRNLVTSSNDPADDLIKNVSPWLQRSIELGIESIVLLDLAFVGTRQGAGTVTACEQISRRWPTIELISGGGVNDRIDIESLLGAGCQRILVGTALHHDSSAATLFSKH